MGTTLHKVNEGEADLKIANLTTIGEIGVESDEVDVTDLDSTGGYKQFIAGFKDAGEVSFGGFIKSEDAMATMLALAESQASGSYRITAVSGSKWEFDGFVKSFKEGEATVDGAREFSGSIRISGKPTYTPATPSL